MSVWVPLALPLIAAILLILIPGMAVLLAAGKRGPMSLLLSPGISVSLIAGSAVVFGPTGLFWNVWMPAAATAVLCALILLVRLVLRRRRAAISQTHRDPAPHDRPFSPLPDRWGNRSGISILVALCVGALLFLRHAKNILGTPDAFAQRFDNVFHLSAIQWILDTGDASTLTLSRLNASPGTPIYYPAAWHDLASLVVQLTGCSVPVASNAIMITAFLIWTAGCLFLVRCTLDAGPVTTVATAVVSASLPAFPIMLTDWGTLFPNLLGYALVPLAVGLGVQLYRVGTACRYPAAHALGLLVLVLPGLGMAQPNAAMLFLLAGIPVIVIATIRALRTRSWIPATANLALLIIIASIWQVIRPPASQIHWGTYMSVPGAALEALLQDPFGYTPAYLVSALVVVGLALILISRRNVWLVFSWGLVALAWVIAAACPIQSLRVAVTGVWYNDPHRLAAALPLLSVPLAALTIQWVEDHVLRRIPWRPGTALRAAIDTAVIAALLTGFTQWAPYLNGAVNGAANSFRITPGSLALNTDEYDLVMQLPELVPSGAVIATNPWNGSSLAYPLTGIRTTTHHVLSYYTPEVTEINDHLDEAGTDPAAVCPAIEDLGVDYVLDFGDRGIDKQSHDWSGFDNLDGAPGFELVAQEGDAKLYEVTACG